MSDQPRRNRHTKPLRDVRQRIRAGDETFESDTSAVPDKLSLDELKARSGSGYLARLMDKIETLPPDPDCRTGNACEVCGKGFRRYRADQVTCGATACQNARQRRRKAEERAGK